jgi:hypothetical protein
VPNLLLFASGVGLGAATAALWVQRWRRADHRFFAGVVSIAVTMSFVFGRHLGRYRRSHPCLLLGFLSAPSLFSSRYDCIESYRSRRRTKVLRNVRPPPTGERSEWFSAILRPVGEHGLGRVFFTVSTKPAFTGAAEDLRRKPRS